MTTDDDVSVESPLCIICCEKKKSLLLLPCRHQHTCDACWSLWSIQCMSNKIDESFDESDDDATKPTCPYCKIPVDTTISVLNRNWVLYFIDIRNLAYNAVYKYCDKKSFVQKCCILFNEFIFTFPLVIY